MNRKLNCITAILFFLAAVFVAEKGLAQTTDPTAGLAEARALVEDGRYQEALTLLRELAQQPVADANILFLTGVAAIEASRKPDINGEERESLLDEAIVALRTMLINRPDLIRVRLELARAFFLKGEDGLSREHFERVLAGDPPAVVAANVRVFLAQIRARRRWNMHVGAAVAPDTNIGGTSAERTVYLSTPWGRLPFQRDAEELITSGVGLSVWAGGEYQQPLGERLRLRAGADVSRREHKGKDFDRLFASVHTGPRWLVDARTEASVLASIRRQWTGNVPLFDEFGARIEARRRLTPRLVANTGLSWHDRRYRERTDLSGPVRDLSLGGTWTVLPVLQVNGGLGYGQDRTEAERWRNTRRWLRVGMSLAMPYGFTVGGGGEVRWTNYEGNWFTQTGTDEPRADRTRSLRVSVHNRAFTVLGFSPELTLVREIRKTNTQIYDYERTAGELRFVRQF